MLKASTIRPSFCGAAMSRSIQLLLAGALVPACCGGCDAYRQNQQRQQQEMLQEQEKSQVKETANTFLKSIPQSENQAKWGLENSTVFGPGVVGASKQADSPLTYDAVANVWCSGNTIEGHPVKLKRTVVMKVVQGEDSKWQVTDYTLSEEEPLSFWEQGATWVLWCFLVPLVIILITFFVIYLVWQFAAAVQWEWLQNLLSTTVSIVLGCTGLWWIETTLKCFGSWTVGALFWAILLSLFGLIAFRIHKTWKQKK